MSLSSFRSMLRRRIFAIFAMTLVLFSVVGGPNFNGAGVASPFAFSVYAANGNNGQNNNGQNNNGQNNNGQGNNGNHSVNDLWNQVSENSVGEGLNNNNDANLGTVVNKAQAIAKTITSVLTVISFVCLLFWVARLAMSAGNPQTRRIAISGILFSGIALTLFGGAWIVVSFFWNLLSAT